MDWQRRLLDDLFELGPDGRRRYRTAYIGVPRKNGKSTLGAALALYGLIEDGEPGAEVYSVAGDRQQASIVFQEAKAMVESDPDLSSLCRVYRTHIEVPSTRSIYRVLSADAPRQQGLSPSFVIFDEVHVQPNEDLWAAMTLGSGVRRQPLVIGITTAGFDRNSLAHRLYEHGRRVQSGEEDDSTFFFRWWEPSNGDCDWRDPNVWAEANPSYGVTLKPEDFESAVRSTPESMFRRYRLNQWTTTREAWLPHGAWGKCADPDRKVTDPVVLGFDGSWTGDSTALVGCTIADKPHVFVLRSWERPTDDPSWRVPSAEVDQALHTALAEYDVREVACDPHFWRAQLEQWSEEGIPVHEWPTNSLPRIVPALREFETAVLEERLTHDGDPRLARHVANAVVKEDARGRRIVKDTTNRKIDLAVASVIAFDRARRAEPSSVYEERGFLFL